MNAHSTDAFARLWALGYRRLCPIIPPGAPISERSSLFKRLQRGDDARGKMPGVRWADGTWSGYDFVAHESTEADLPRWQAMGAGVGIKTGAGLALIDADTLNPEWAAAIRQVLGQHFGVLPLRVGRAPKAGYLVRVEGAFQYARVEFGERDAKGRLRDRVEILYEGRQFVAHGTHPDTGKPYHWPDGVPALVDVPTVSAASLLAFLDELRHELPAASPIVQEGAATEIDQASLRGDIGRISRAVAALPNTSDLFPTRESYCSIGFAIKAACGPEHEPEGFALFADWCERWQDGTNESDIVAADWKRMKPPFRRGASWLFDLAEQHSGGQFTTADIWTDARQEPLFPEEPRAVTPGLDPGIHATPYGFPDPAAIPKRETLYAWHYTRQFVSATVAPSKVGKTSLIIAEALAMASGKPLLGVPVHGGPHRVWLWNGEDPMEELERRTAAAMLHYGLTREDIGDRLFMNSGRDMEIVLATETRDGARIAAPVVAAVTRAILDNRIDVFQVDPFVSTHRVSENDNGAIDLVAKRWANIANTTRCAVDLVHHVRKLNGGEVTVEDSRGAVALIAASRSARALAKMTKAEANGAGVSEEARRRLFRFADTSANLAPPSGDAGEWMALVSVALGNGGGDGADGFMRGDSVGVVARWEREDTCGAEGGSDAEADAMERVRAGEWRRDMRAGDAWIGVPVAQAFKLDLDDPTDKGRAKSIVSAWVKSGRLIEVSRRDAQRHMRVYVECGSDNVSENLFE